MSNTTLETNHFKLIRTNSNWRMLFLLPVFFCSCLINLTASDYTALEEAFSCDGKETGIVLVGNNGKEISIRNGQELCSSQINFTNGFIRVKTSGKVGSMRIWVTGATNHDVLENHSPYDGKRFDIRTGDYKVRTKIFSESRGGGSGCNEATFKFSIKSCASSCRVSGGRITTTAQTSICVDGVPDPINVTVSGGVGSNRGWIITDNKRKILALPQAPPFDLDGAGVGTCFIYYIRYEDGLRGLRVGQNVGNLNGCFDLSNRIDIVRQAPDGGRVTTQDGATRYVATAGNVLVPVTRTTRATELSYWYIITDDKGVILNFLNPGDASPTDDAILDLSAAPPGECRIWGWSYRGEDDPTPGNNISSLTDGACETISKNFIRVIREAPVTCNGEVTNIELVSRNGKRIGLSEGQELCENQIGFSQGLINVRTRGTVGSMTISIKGAVTNNRVENKAPYDSKTFRIKAGSYQVKIKIFSRSKGQGDVCSERTFNFTVKDCANNRPNCKDIKIQTSRNKIVLSGLKGAPIVQVNITKNGKNFFNCVKCKASETIDIGSGQYRIQVSYFDKSMKRICNEVKNFNNRNLVTDASGRIATNTSNELSINNFSLTGQKEGIKIQESSVNVNLTLDSKQSIDFSVYPNPASSELRIDATSLAGKSGQLFVLNPYGQIVQQLELGDAQPGIITLNVRNFQSGLYLINVQLTDGEQLLKKVIVR